MKLRFIPGGKHGFVVSSLEDVPGAIDEVISQIRQGELDAHITPASKKKDKPESNVA